MPSEGLPCICYKGGTRVFLPDRDLRYDHCSNLMPNPIAQNSGL